MSDSWDPLRSMLQTFISENYGDEINQTVPLQGNNQEALKMISYCIQKSQEMSDTIELLQAENDRLTQMLDNETLKNKALQGKLKTIGKSKELAVKMKEEYQAVLQSIKAQKLNKEEKFTSTNYLIDSKEESTQIDFKCEQCLERNQTIKCDFKNSVNEVHRKTVACQVNNTETTTASMSDAIRLQDDVNALKEVINARERIWGKLATRERVQRLQMNKLHEQLEDLNQMEFKQRVELELKNKRIQELSKDLEFEKMQVLKLKELLTRTEDKNTEFS